LRACHVVLDPAERRRIIAEGASAAAAAAGLTLVEDEGLLAENAGLTEWPVPLLGSFDPAFLEVPREVIQLTMRTNQKYFACVDGEGKLAPSFVCTANIDASDGGASIVAGNERVLSARLSDARFFWEQDLKVPLEAQAAKLSQIVFHEKLGTVADKVDRVAKLARWLVEEGIVKPPPGESAEELASFADTAARLAKADLVTGLVGEFPELQGVIGGHLALCQGHARAVSDAIRDHYKPAGQGDEAPTAPVTVAVSLADKLDTICCFFSAELKPTGSKDPFALRRAAISSIELIVRCGLRLPLTLAVRGSLANIVRSGEAGGVHRLDRNAIEILDFFADRLKVQQREAGVRHDLIDAVFALGGEDDLVRLLARVRALQSFVETPEGKDLLAGYKRAANILKKEGWAQTVIPAKAGIPAGDELGASGAQRGTASENDPAEIPASAGMTSATAAQAEHRANAPLAYDRLDEEEALVAALDSAEPRARAAVEAEHFEGAMAALATLRAPVDSFFDKVTVNDPDPAKREARLALLARMRDAVHQVADFSRIEG
jgi:glycyl-tRNA synthetase beta chain